MVMPWSRSACIASITNAHSKGMPRLSDIALTACDFSFRQRAGLVQQAPHERGFAVVHVPDDHELQLIHHMYPSARRRSNASSDSWSIARPARSGTRVASSSAMISSMLEASLATGKVMSLSPSDRYRLPSLAK